MVFNVKYTTKGQDHTLKMPLFAAISCILLHSVSGISCFISFFLPPLVAEP